MNIEDLTASILSSRKRAFGEGDISRATSDLHGSDIVELHGLSWTDAERLVTAGVLLPFNMPFKRFSRTCYVTQAATVFEALTTVHPASYISHIGAAFLHGLIDTMPSTIYLNIEQRMGSPGSGTLSQRSIDGAFRRPARVSTNKLEISGRPTLVLITGKNTGNLGVEELPVDLKMDDSPKVRVTSLERTLVDMVVRPVCSGGPSVVLGAFRRAAGRVRVNRLFGVLKELKHVYPYHQAIGYYLDASGLFRSSEVEMFRGIPMEFDFYLDNEMLEPVYDGRWKLHVPRGLAR